MTETKVQHPHWRVKGEAHGAQFDAWGFHTEDEAVAYASQVIDGDVDSTIEVLAPPCPTDEAGFHVSRSGRTTQRDGQDAYAYRCHVCDVVGEIQDGRFVPRS